MTNSDNKTPKYMNVGTMLFSVALLKNLSPTLRYILIVQNRLIDITTMQRKNSGNMADIFNISILSHL